MRQLARISATDGAVAVVDMQDTAACARCSSGQGCGAAVFLSPRRGATLQLALPNPQGFQIHQWVYVVAEAPALSKLILIQYGLPLSGLLAGALTGEALSANDGWSLLPALCGLLAGHFLAGRYLPRCIPGLGLRLEASNCAADIFLQKPELQVEPWRKS